MSQLWLLEPLQITHLISKIVKIVEAVLASKFAIPDFFQLILKIYVKIDF